MPLSVSYTRTSGMGAGNIYDTDIASLRGRNRSFCSFFLVRALASSPLTDADRPDTPERVTVRALTLKIGD